MHKLRQLILGEFFLFFFYLRKEILLFWKRKTATTKIIIPTMKTKLSWMKNKSEIAILHLISLRRMRLKSCYLFCRSWLINSDENFMGCEMICDAKRFWCNFKFFAIFPQLFYEGCSSDCRCCFMRCIICNFKSALRYLSNFSLSDSIKWREI